MRSGRARMKGYNDDTNSSSDREESFNNEESKDEKQGMSSPSDATSTTTVNKAKGGDLKVIKLADDAAAKGMCVLYVSKYIFNFRIRTYYILPSSVLLPHYILTTLNRRSKHNKHKQQQ